MSTLPSWIFFRVGAGEASPLARRLAEAEARARADRRLGPAIALWEGEGPAAPPVAPFFASGFERLACEIVSDRGPIPAARTGEFGFLSLAGVPPAQVLFTGLGRERARRLPGFFGNLLVRPEDVARAREAVLSTLEVDFGAFAARVRRALPSEGEDDLRAVLLALPGALERAAAARAGLLVLNAGELGPPWWLVERSIVHGAMLARAFGERRALAADAAEAAARLRHERDAGILPLAALEVAAHAGDPAARLAIGAARPSGRFRDVVHGLARWGNEPYLRAFAALARALLPVWKERLPEIETSLREALPAARLAASQLAGAPRRAVMAAERCLREPGPASQDAAVLAAEVAGRLRGAIAAAGKAKTPAGVAAQAAAAAASMASVYEPEGDDVTAGTNHPAPDAAARLLGAERAREIVRDAVAPWALGLRDPLRS
jgi:hypothetical protein